MGSFQALVQSQQFTPEHVLNSTNSFLEAFYDDTVLSSNFSAGFNQTVEILRQTLNKRDLTLEDKTNRLWNQILSGQYQFDFKEQQVDMLEELDVQKFREFYDESIVEDASRHRLVVVVYGKGKKFEPPAQHSIDYDHLNQTSTSLPLNGDT